MTPPDRHPPEALRARREARRRRARRRRVGFAAALVVGAGLVAAGWTHGDRLVEVVRGPGPADAADDRGAPGGAPARAAAPPPSAAPSPDRKAAAKRERLAGKRIRIAAVGDVALDGSPPTGLFGSVSPELRGDVVLGNLEGTLATGGVSKCVRPGEATPSPNCYAFRAPPAFASELRRAGFTVLNLANNHSADFGWEGQTQTVAALAEAKIGITGFGPEPYEARVRGVRVAVLGFAPLAAGWELLDVPAAAALVRRAATRADIVVVTMHAGAEGPDAAHVTPGGETFLGEPRGDVMAFARAAIDAGADLVVGHGPHVLRGIEWYRGRAIAYSLGNFAANGNLNTAGPGGVSAILRVTLRGDGTWGGGRLVPVRLDAEGVPAPDPAGAAYAAVQELSAADFGKRAARIGANGQLLRPPRS